MENHGHEYVAIWLLSNSENSKAEKMNVISSSRVLISGASQAYFSEIRKQMSDDNNGMPSTLNANQSEPDEEITSVNFFLLSH